MGDAFSETINSLGHALSAIFRHLIPGVLVLSAAAVVNPDWFTDVDIKNGNHLIVLSVLAITVGNLWFVLHRYSIQQVIDLVFFFFGQKGNYHNWVANLVCNFFQSSSDFKEIKQHVKFRSSSVILMYITAEVLFVATCSATSKSILYQYVMLRFFLFLLSPIIFLAAIWQNYIVLKIEQEVAEDGKKHKSKN